MFLSEALDHHALAFPGKRDGLCLSQTITLSPKALLSSCWMGRYWAISALGVSCPGSVTMAERIFMGHKSLAHYMPPYKAASHEPHILHNKACHILCDSCEHGDHFHEEINGIFLLETDFSFSLHDEIYFIRITVTSNSHMSVKISNIRSCFM